MATNYLNGMNPEAVAELRLIAETIKAGKQYRWTRKRIMRLQASGNLVLALVHVPLLLRELGVESENVVERNLVVATKPRNTRLPERVYHPARYT